MAYAKINELSYWCPPGSIDAAYTNEKVCITLDTPSGDKAVINSIHLDDGATLEFVKSFNHRSEANKQYIESSTGLKVSSKEMSVKDVLFYVIRFEEFLSVMTLSYTVERNALFVYSKSSYKKIDNQKYYTQIELIVPLYKVDKKTDIYPFDFLCSYIDVSMSIQEGLNRFYSNTSILQIWNNLIDSLEVKRVYSSNEFLVVVQAVDGFSIRFRKKEKTFLDQLRTLRDEFRNVGDVSLTDCELESIRGSRHYYSHILNLSAKEKRNVLEGAELYTITKKLRVLLICCVLNFIGLNNEQIDKLLKDSCNPIIQMY